LEFFCLTFFFSFVFFKSGHNKGKLVLKDRKYERIQKSYLKCNTHMKYYKSTLLGESSLIESRVFYVSYTLPLFISLFFLSW